MKLKWWEEGISRTQFSDRISGQKLWHFAVKNLFLPCSVPGPCQSLSSCIWEQLLNTDVVFVRESLQVSENSGTNLSKRRDRVLWDRLEAKAGILLGLCISSLCSSLCLCLVCWETTLF